MTGERSWSDQRIENFVGNLLRVGVLLSALVVFLGGIVYVARHGFEPMNFSTFRSEPAEFRNVGGVLRAVGELRGRGIIQLGLLLLIATPVARVAFSIFGFAAERDYLYVCFTVFVFALLLYSLFGSF